MAHYAYRQYQRNQTETASGGELILLLYGGAIKYLNKARLHLELSELEPAHKSLVAAQNIVLELMFSLDMRQGDLATNLFDVYNFMYRRLVEANIKKDVAAVDEVYALFRDLNVTWEEVIRRPRVTAAPIPAAEPIPLPRRAAPQFV